MSRSPTENVNYTDKGDLSGRVIISKYIKNGESAYTKFPDIVLRQIDDQMLWVLEVTRGGTKYTFPSAGRRWETGLFVYPNIGYYWTSTVSPDDGTYHSAYAMVFDYNSSISLAPKYYRASSASVRCIRSIVL